MFKSSYSRQKKITLQVRNFLRILSTALLFILFFNAIALGQPKSAFSTIAETSFFGGLSGFVVGASLIPVTDRNTGELLARATAGGLMGGLAYGTIEVVGGKKVVDVVDWISYGGGAGLAIDYGVDLMTDQNVEDNLKWFVIGGATAGLIYGIYRNFVRGKPEKKSLPTTTSKSFTKIDFLKPWVQINKYDSLEFGVNFVSLSL